MTAAGCSESLPENFGQIEGVYFYNQQENSTLTDKISKTFIYEDNDQIEVPVKVQLLGRVTQHPRQVSIRVHSDNALQGVDYQLSGDAILPADSVWLEYVIIVKRTEALQHEIKSLSVELEPNDNFIIPFTTQTQSDGTVTSVVKYQIEFSDQFTAPPSEWQDGFVGDFSQQKFELACRVMELPRADFNEPGKISAAKWLYIQTVMLTYVKDQIDLKNAGKNYDHDAFDEQGNALSFTGNS